jgi:hypothetical protein
VVTVEVLVLGDRFLWFDGTPALLSPGVSTLSVQRFPATVDLVATIRLLVPWSELDLPHTFEIDIVDELGRTVWRDDHGCRSRQLHTVKQAESSLPFEDQRPTEHVTLNKCALPRPGWYFVIVSVDGREQARTSIRAARGAKMTAAMQAAG